VSPFFQGGDGGLANATQSPSALPSTRVYNTAQRSGRDSASRRSLPSTCSSGFEMSPYPMCSSSRRMVVSWPKLSVASLGGSQMRRRTSSYLLYSYYPSHYNCTHQPYRVFSPFRRGVIGWLIICMATLCSYPPPPPLVYDFSPTLSSGVPLLLRV